MIRSITQFLERTASSLQGSTIRFQLIPYPHNFKFPPRPIFRFFCGPLASLAMSLSHSDPMSSNLFPFLHQFMPEQNMKFHLRLSPKAKDFEDICKESDLEAIF